jgi:hypothetical protein
MARDENDGNHSDGEERGVQALWAAIDARDKQLLCMERTLEALQQIVARLGVDGNRNQESPLESHPQRGSWPSLRRTWP